MDQMLKDCLFIGLKSRGFDFDFEAKADISGGFECYIFSNESHVAIVTGENSAPRRKHTESDLVYSYYCCPIGDGEYLRKFLQEKDILGNLSLLNGEYGELFTALIQRVNSYGVKNADSRIRHEADNDLSGRAFCKGEQKHNRKVIPLFKEDRTAGSETPPDFRPRDHAQNYLK